jgi:hypothetical protein
MMDLSTLDELHPVQELVDPQEAERERWFELRRGKFTSSRFGDLMKRGRGKDEWGQVALTYMYQVAAERMGSFSFGFSSSATKWGVDNEANAIAAYAAKANCTVDSTPFQFFDHKHYGGTPDGLVGDDGVVEVKCPYSPAEHFKTFVTKTVPVQYYWQVFGHLLVTGRQWCDFISFDPRLEGPNGLVVIRVERDQSVIDVLQKRIDQADKVIKHWLA